MPVPEYIRRVPRPVNTVVQDNGGDGPKRFIVRARNRVKYVADGNPQPVNGGTVGYIIDGKFVPLVEKTAADGPNELSFGGSALIRSVSEDILHDLLAVYPPNDAYSIMSLAALKVLKPRISSTRFGSAYRSSFISVYYPGAAVSKNSVSSLYQKLGEDGKKRAAFFDRRMEAVCADHHVIIDGTLKQDTSRVNDLSAFSYKARLKGCEDISLLYAYDLEKMEPICAQVFPGNCIDAVSYRSFVKDNKITKGIIIADKGFPPNMIRKELEENKDLHYLTPLKRNDKRIKTLNLQSFEGVLKGIPGNVQYKKVKVSDNLYLYAFRDFNKATAEERSWLDKIKLNDKNIYDQDDFIRKRDRFGFILFESDLDMTPETAYLSYQDRWKLEMVFKTYKSDDCLDRTSVHGDFSIHGSEFVNFISTLITSRIICKATDAGIFEDMTYGDMMDDLNTSWRKKTASRDELPSEEDDLWIHTLPMVMELLVKLGLAKGTPKPEPKKRGRKPGSKNQKKAEEETAVPEKRSVGRPRKNPLPDPEQPKRSVGRPRKNPPKDPNAEKKSVGRPRKNPPKDPNAEKRPVGRPRKSAQTDTEQ